MTSTRIVQRIVVLFGSGTVGGSLGTLAAESSRLASLLRNTSEPVDVSVISLGLSRTITGVSEHIRLDDSGRSAADRILSGLGAFALRSRFATFPLGRLLNSLGPVDQGRVFWRTLRRHPEAMRLLKSVDVAIATDLVAMKTAWLAVHRGWVDDAYYDHRSASVGMSWQLPSADTTEKSLPG